MGGTEHRLDMYDESEKHYQLYADYTKQLYGEKEHGVYQCANDARQCRGILQTS